jgi:hypothetical protein
MGILAITDLDFDRNITATSPISGGTSATANTGTIALPGFAIAVAEADAKGIVTFTSTRTAVVVRSKNGSSGSGAGAGSGAGSTDGKKLYVAPLSVSFSVSFSL